MSIEARDYVDVSKRGNSIEERHTVFEKRFSKLCSKSRVSWRHESSKFTSSDMPSAFRAARERIPLKSSLVLSQNAFASISLTRQYGGKQGRMFFIVSFQHPSKPRVAS